VTGGRRAWRILRAACAGVAGTLLGASAAQAEPRLFFDASQIDAIRQRASQAPFTAMVSAIEDALNPSVTGTYPIADEARNAAYMYILTGDEAYAQRALDMSLATIGDTAFWNVDGSKGLTRAHMQMGVAIAYDLCKDSSAWSAQREFVSREIRKNSDSLIRSGGAGWPGDTKYGNNWWAVRYSAAGLGYLACDEAGTAANLATAYSKLTIHLNYNLTGANPYSVSGPPNGWNPEGVGYTTYPWRFTGPFGIAMKRLTGQDITNDPNITPTVQYALWSTYPGMLPLPRLNGELGIHADFGDDNAGWEGSGAFNLSFAYAPQQYIAGMKWQYDRADGALGDNTWDPNSAGAFWGILYYPDKVTARNPAEVYGKTYVDASYGMALFRSRYQDEADYVAQLSARGRSSFGGHSGPDASQFRIMGGGTVWATGWGRGGFIGANTGVFQADPSSATISNSATSGVFGNLTATQANERGDGYAVTYGSNFNVVDMQRRMIVDYSGRSGAEALYVIADTSQPGTAASDTTTGVGRFWRFNTPEFNTIEVDPLDPSQFTLIGPDGQLMFGKILYGDASTVRTGKIKRDSSTDPNSVGFSFDGENYQYNNWIDFQGVQSGGIFDGQFLVVLAAYKPGATRPVISGVGSGINQTITVGQEVITINWDGVHANTSVTTVSVAGWAPTDYAFSGTAGDGRWDGFGNWSPMGKPDTTGDSAAFDGAGATVDLVINRTVKALSFGAAAGPYAIGTTPNAQTINLRDNIAAGLGNGTVSSDSPAAQTINASLYTPQTLTFNVNSAPLTVAGNVLAGNIAKTGGGTLNLDGSLVVNPDAAPGGAMSLSSSGGAVNINGTVSLASGAWALNLSGAGISLNGSVDVAGGAALTISGVNAGRMLKSGDGLLVIASASGYSGDTTVAGGALRAADGVGLPAASTLRLRGGVLETSGTLARALGAASGQVNWSDGVDGGSGGFAAHGGALDVTLSGGAALVWGSGGFVPDGAALVLGSATADDRVTLSNPIDLGSGTREIRVADNAGSGSDVARLSGAISGAGGIEKTGPGTLQLTGANSFAGPLTIRDGAVEAVAGVGLPATNALRLRGGVLEGSGAWSGSIGSGAQQVNWSDGTDGGSGGFAARGGNLGVSLNGGAALTWGAGGFVPAGSALVLGSATADSVVDVQNAIDLGSAVREIKVVDNPLSAADVGRISGVLWGTGGINKTGQGVLELAGANAYTGGTTVAQGTLRVGNAAAIGASSAVTVQRGGTLDLADGSVAIASLAGNGQVALGTGTLSVGTANTSATFSGVISGSGGLVKVGTGTLTLSECRVLTNGVYVTVPSAYTGATIVEEGTLALTGAAPAGAPGLLGNSTGAILVGRNTAGTNDAALVISFGDGVIGRDITVRAGNSGVATLGGANTSGNALFSGAITLEKTANFIATLAPVDPNASPGTQPPAATVTFSGAIGGVGGINKVGNGTVILTGANSYSGDTTILQGAIRAADGAGLPASSALRLRGGVIETSGTFGRGVGTAGGQVNWADGIDGGSGGFSAQGAALTVNLGGVGATQTWDAGGFVPAGSALVFGSPNSSHAVTFQNPIDLGATGANTREIRVIDNPAATADLATISGVISSSGGTQSLHKSGDGTLVLSATNTYNGSTRISGGALRATKGTHLPAASTLELRGGVLEINGGGSTNSSVSSVNTTTDTITTSANHNLTEGQIIIFTGNVPAGLLVNTPYYVRNPAAKTLQLSLTASGGIVDLTGTTTGAALSRPSFTAALGAGAGDVNWGDGGGGFAAQGADRNVVIATGTAPATLNWGAASFVPDGQPLLLGSITGDRVITLLNPINLGAVDRTIDVADNTATGNDRARLSGVISGTGGIVKTGRGTLELAAANTYGGATTINQGTLRVGTAGALPASTTVEVGRGNYLDLQTYATTIARLTGSGTVNSSSGSSLTVGDSTNFTYSGLIEGSTAVTKTGSGTWTLAGSNSGYSGATTIAQGMLVLAANGGLGSITAGTTVQAGASLGFSGGIRHSITEPITINGSGIGGSGAIVNVADSNAFTGAITLASDSTIGASAGSLDLRGLVAMGGRHLTVTGSSSLELSGTIDNATGGAASITKTGGGTLTISAIQNHGPGAALNVGGGTAVLQSNAGVSALPTAAAVANLSVSVSGGQLKLASNQALASAASSVAGGVDLSGRQMSIYTLADESSLNAAVGAGRIIDTTAGANTAIGIADLPDAYGTAAVLVRLTRLGDATLDGVVNFADLLVLSQNYNAAGRTWDQGDSNYDGTVNFADLLALSQNYNQSYPSAADSAGVDGGASVPEPGALGVLAIGAMGLLARRRR